MSDIVGIDLGTTNSLVATVDSGIALVLADAVLEKFGGDSVGETRRNIAAYLDALPVR